MAKYRHKITGKVADLDPEYAEVFEAFEPVADEDTETVDDENVTDDVPQPPAKRTARRVPSGEVSASQPNGEPTA